MMRIARAFFQKPQPEISAQEAARRQMNRHTSPSGICPWHHVYECDDYLTAWREFTYPRGVPRPRDHYA